MSCRIVRTEHIGVAARALAALDVSEWICLGLVALLLPQKDFLIAGCNTGD